MGMSALDGLAHVEAIDVVATAVVTRNFIDRYFSC